MYKVFIDNRPESFQVEDEELLKKSFPDHKYVEAGGGLVFQNGKYLFIRRHDKWDIPKGKLEKGESIERCAEREVEEECNVHNVKIDKKLCDTWHTYEQKGKLWLKKTYWYLMSADEMTDLTPQTEEGITEVRMFTEDEFDEIRQDTYLSIIDVLDALEV